MARETLYEQAQQLNRIIDTFLEDGEVNYGLAAALRFTVKEIVLQQNDITGRQAWANRDSKSIPDRIQIGGGAHTLEGYLNVDIMPPANLVCDIREGIPLEDSSARQIFSEHCFEHLDYPRSFKLVLGECKRILRTGGEIIIGVPDAEQAIHGYIHRDQKLMKEYLTRWYKKRRNLNHYQDPLHIINLAFRDQEDDPKYNIHYWGHDFNTMKHSLEEAGFEQVENWKFDSTIANPKREWGSLYVTARSR